LVRDLKSVEERQRTKVTAIAETSTNWPVLLSLNPQDIKWAKDYLLKLEVGSKAPTPTRPGQRIDSRNFWTRLAREALRACRINIRLVPALEAHCAEATKECQSMKIWRTQTKATYHTLPNGDVIILADWQKQCVKLSEPITDNNFKDWWGVMKLCVLEHWKSIPEDYAKALAKISDKTAATEFQKRNLALGQVRKALCSLTGLRL
jgi:hypothetical protein